MAQYKVLHPVEVAGIIRSVDQILDEDVFNFNPPEDATEDWIDEKTSLLRSGHIQLLE